MNYQHVSACNKAINRLYMRITKIKLTAAMYFILTFQVHADRYAKHTKKQEACGERQNIVSTRRTKISWEQVYKILKIPNKEISR